MKLASYRTREGNDFGLVVGDGIVSLKSRLALSHHTLIDLLASQTFDRLRELGSSLKPDVQISEVEFLPVIPRPEKFLAIGLNYREHAEQIGRTVAARPGLFSRFPDTLVGHKQPIIRPRISSQLDFEGELAVIIGKAGRYIPEASAMEHIAGYACFVDGSVRDYQKQSTTAGKNFPATGPFGPWMVTRDEILDPSKMVLTTRVNGQIMQQAGVELMIHTIATLISYVSEITPLNPGDVLSTGTPGGVGHKRNPPVWLRPGDTLEFEISGIGTLTNTIIDEKD
jgi:2-keto-4-pentenoate hydratase/2-oxohepta-3-ene-1,7-dioic acid hydratase in catechol pathway